MITMRQAIDAGYVKPVNVDATCVCVTSNKLDGDFASEIRVGKPSKLTLSNGYYVYNLSNMTSSVKGTPEEMLALVHAATSVQTSPRYGTLADKIKASDGSINLAEAWACAFPLETCENIKAVRADADPVLEVGQTSYQVQSPRPFDVIDKSSVAIVKTYTERGKIHNLQYMKRDGTWCRIGGYDDDFIRPHAEAVIALYNTNNSLTNSPVAMRYDSVSAIVRYLNDKGFNYEQPAALSQVTVSDVVGYVNGFAGYIDSDEPAMEIAVTTFMYPLGTTLNYTEPTSSWQFAMSQDSPILSCSAYSNESVQFVTEYTDDATYVTGHAAFQPDAVNLCTPDLSFAPFIAAARGSVALDFLADLVAGIPDGHFVDTHGHGITSATKVSPSMTVDDLYQFSLEYDDPNVGLPLNFSPVYAWANKAALLPSSLSISFPEFSAKLFNLMTALKDKVSRFFTAAFDMDNNLRSLLLRDADAIDNEIIRTSTDSYDSVEQASVDYQSSGDSYVDYLLQQIGMDPVTVELHNDSGEAELLGFLFNCMFELSGKDPNPQVKDIQCGGKYLNTPILKFKYTSQYDDYRYVFTQHMILEVPPQAQFCYVYVRPAALDDTSVMQACNEAVDEICYLFNSYSDVKHHRLIDFANATSVRNGSTFQEQMARSANFVGDTMAVLDNIATVLSFNSSRNAYTDINLLSNYTMSDVLGAGYDAWGSTAIPAVIENGYRVYYCDQPLFPRFYHVGDNQPEYLWTAGVVCAIAGIAYTRSYLKKQPTRTASFIPALLASKVASVTDVSNSDVRREVLNNASLVSGVAALTTSVQQQVEQTKLNLDDVNDNVNIVKTKVDALASRGAPLWPRP